jgi:chromosome segregation ATPase
MSRLKNICALVLMCCALLLSQQSCGYCSETSGATQDRLTVSMTDWQTLRENNKKQATLLTELSTELQTAQTQLTRSKAELSTARTALTELQTQLIEQKQLSMQLQNQLTELQQNQTNAKNSIEAANQSLSAMNQEIKAERQQRDKTERQLRQQKTMWQILAIGVGAWAAYK